MPEIISSSDKSIETKQMQEELLKEKPEIKDLKAKIWENEKGIEQYQDEIAQYLYDNFNTINKTISINSIDFDLPGVKIVYSKYSNALSLTKENDPYNYFSFNVKIKKIEIFFNMHISNFALNKKLKDYKSISDMID
jgi:hypothetical protein